MSFVGYFEIDIISALSGQLIKTLDNLSIGKLDTESLSKIRPEQGVYKLYHLGKLVYVGKSDNLNKRLHEHRKKISGRKNLFLEEVGFKCLYVHKNWTALAPETSLIKYYKKMDGSECTWNGNGFGPHDPGRDRETTNKPIEGFDSQFPINDGWICDWISAGEWNCKKLLESLKLNLPFLLRYETLNPKKWKDGHPDYNLATVNVPGDRMPARMLLSAIVRQLPGWQATIFPSHMILYKENRLYRHGATL